MANQCTISFSPFIPIAVKDSMVFFAVCVVTLSCLKLDTVLGMVFLFIPNQEMVS